MKKFLDGVEHRFTQFIIFQCGQESEGPPTSCPVELVQQLRLQSGHDDGRLDSRFLSTVLLDTAADLWQPVRGAVLPERPVPVSELAVFTVRLWELRKPVGQLRKLLLDSVSTGNEV